MGYFKPRPSQACGTSAHSPVGEPATLCVRTFEVKSSGFLEGASYRSRLQAMVSFRLEPEGSHVVLSPVGPTNTSAECTGLILAIECCVSLPQHPLSQHIWWSKPGQYECSSYWLVTITASAKDRDLTLLHLRWITMTLTQAMRRAAHSDQSVYLPRDKVPTRAGHVPHASVILTAFLGSPRWAAAYALLSLGSSNDSSELALEQTRGVSNDCEP